MRPCRGSSFGLFLRLAEEPRLLLPRWTEEIWAETRRGESSETETTTVECSEQVTVRAGTLVAWNIFFNQVDRLGVQTDGIRWVAPVIGEVKSQSTTVLEDKGFDIDTHGELAMTATNTPFDLAA